MKKYRIILEFETDDDITLGMITRGLEYNGNDIRKAMLSEHPGLLAATPVAYKILEAKETTAQRDLEDVLDRKIDFSLFSVRAVNCLKFADVETVRELVRHQKSDFNGFRNFGNKTMVELDNFIESHGLHWGMDV